MSCATLFAAAIAFALPPEAHPAFVAGIGSPEFRMPSSASVLGTSADGSRLYTVDYSDDFLLLTWDAGSGRLLKSRRLGRPGEALTHIGHAPEGLRLVARVAPNSDYLLRVIDPDTGKTLRTGKPWKEPPEKSGFGGGRLEWYTFSPDGAWMLRSGDGFGLFNTATGERTVLASANGEKVAGGYFGFSRDERLFYQYRDSGKNISVYSLPDGKRAFEIPNPGSEQIVADFTPDSGSLLLWVRHDDAWSLDVWDLVRKSRRALLGGERVPGRISFAPDGKTFARVPVHEGGYYPEGDWEIRDFATGKLISRVPAVGFVGPVVFSADGRTLFTDPGSRQIVAWDVANGTAKATTGPLGPVTRFRFTPDDRLIGLAGGFVHIWDPLTGKEELRRRVPRAIDWTGGAVFDSRDWLSFTEIGDHLVAWDFRREVERRSPLALKRLPNSAVEQWLTPDGNLHVEYVDHTVILRDPATGKEVARIATPKEWLDPGWIGAVQGVAASPDRRWLAIADEEKSPPNDRPHTPHGRVAILDLKGAESPRILELDHRVLSLAFSPEGRFLAAAGGDRPAVSMIDRILSRIVSRYDLGGRPVNSVRFSPDGRMLAVSCGSSTVDLMETATGKFRASVPLHRDFESYIGAQRYLDAVAWDRRSRLLAVAMPDGGVTIWDIRRLGGVSRMTREKAWAALASSDSEASFSAIRALAATPTESLSFLRSKLSPVPSPNGDRVLALIKALGGADFGGRERAEKDLAAMGRLVQPMLRDAVKANMSPEVRKRLIAVLDRLTKGGRTAEEVRAARAVEAVEWMGGAGAGKLLEAWAGGAEGAILTIEARAAVARLRLHR